MDIRRAFCSAADGVGVMADDLINVMPVYEANDRQCCVDRTRNCSSFDCMAWRWQPLMADEAFKTAVKERMSTADESHVKAAAYVVDHRDEFGLPVQPYLGFCGLAGKP